MSIGGEQGEDLGARARIRYAQCWEDAEVLLAGLDCRAGDTCLSVASAGDNALALLTRDPERVICVDYSAAQLACLELRMAAYAALDHDAFLQLYGARPGRRRRALLRECLPHLPSASRQFWQQREAAVVRHGFAGIGRFETYFRIFRRLILPLTQSPENIRRLLNEPMPPGRRRAFFRDRWNNWRWRALFGLFSSAPVLAALGRERAFFAHAQGSLAAQMAARIAHAATVLDPARNPHLHWILTGRFGDDLPVALQPQHFETIRIRLDRLELRHGTLEEEVRRLRREEARIARFNLSDVFEYMTQEASGDLLARLADIGVPGGRLLYWNMMAPRSRPPRLANRLRPLDAPAETLHAADRAFFYRRLVIEEIV